jgi:uncharacterized RDD family membrane protein YckC
MECPHCHSQVRSHAKHCKRCGGAIPSGQYLLDELGLTESAPVVARATPATPRAPSRPSASYHFARLGDRFIAFALDLALLFGLFAIADAWAFMKFGKFEGSELQLTAASLLIALILNSAILFLYGCLLEAACGATLGKVLVGIRVVRTAPRSVLAACALRNLLRIVDGLAFYLVGTAVAACSDARLRLGDICARTAVIEESFGIAAKASAIVLWIGILSGSLWSVPRICSTNDPVQTRYLNQVVLRIGRTENSAYLRVGGFSLDFHS